MNIQFKYEMGQVLKDIVTGFEGVVMGYTYYFTKCRHYGLVQQKLNEKGKPDEWVWIDESRLIPVGKKKVVLQKSEQPTSGVFPDPPEA